MVPSAGRSNRSLTRALRQIVEQRLPVDDLQANLAQRNPGFPIDCLDPRLIPIELLVNPQAWTPRDSGIDEKALMQAHPDLNDAKTLLSSGRLCKIINGEASLYQDLPPIHLQAYLDGLRPGAKKELQHHQQSALEHLATFGWKRFRQGRPLGKDLDRYQDEPEQNILDITRAHNQSPLILVVLTMAHQPTKNKAIPSGWDHIIQDNSSTSMRCGQNCRHSTTPSWAFATAMIDVHRMPLNCCDKQLNDHQTLRCLAPMRPCSGVQIPITPLATVRTV